MSLRVTCHCVAARPTSTIRGLGQCTQFLHYVFLGVPEVRLTMMINHLCLSCLYLSLPTSSCARSYCWRFTSAYLKSFVCSSRRPSGRCSHLRQHEKFLKQRRPHRWFAQSVSMLKPQFKPNLLSA